MAAISDNDKTQPTPPSIRPYARQVFICTDGNCSDPEEARRVKQRFLELARQHDLHRLSNACRVVCTLTDCLGVCTAGPVLVVYPEGIWYHHVDTGKLERIFQEHIVDGQPVDELIFHRLYPPGQEPVYPPAIREEPPVDPLELLAEQEFAEQEALRQARLSGHGDAEPIPDHVRAARERRRRRRAPGP